MRIIAGTWRGRRLEAPPGQDTRPMLDRVRESVFSTIAPWMDGARVLDLFAGTGSLGLEALSRGAAHARFAELDHGARKLLERNVATLGAQERTTVVGGDALSPATWGPDPFDVVFLDPPFPMVRELAGRRTVLEALRTLTSAHLAPEAVVVFHVPRHALGERELPAGLVARERVHGVQSLWYLQVDDELADAADSEVNA